MDTSKRETAVRILAKYNPQDILESYQGTPRLTPGWEREIDSYLHQVLENALTRLMEDAEALKRENAKRKALEEYRTNPELLPGALEVALAYGESLTGVSNKLRTIVWLRQRYPLGLKEAKSYIDIVLR